MWVAVGRAADEPASTSTAVAAGVAAVVTIVAYLIPHSTRGSELDYSQIDRGVNPAEAIETGR